MTPTATPQFQKATIADAALIRDMTCAAYQRWVPVIGREPMPMRVDYQQAIGEHDFDLLTVGGLVYGVLETMIRDDHLWIENIAIIPAEQGKGYGKHLLARAETLAQEAGKTQTRLLTNAAFESNVVLYLRTGYEITATEPFMGGTTVYMTKVL